MKSHQFLLLFQFGIIVFLFVLRLGGADWLMHLVLALALLSIYKASKVLYVQSKRNNYSTMGVCPLS